MTLLDTHMVIHYLKGDLASLRIFRRVNELK